MITKRDTTKVCILISSSLLVGGFGVLGLHRFYMGRWFSGLIWLFTLGLFGIGAILDIFLIPGMVKIENLSRQLLIEAHRTGPLYR